MNSTSPYPDPHELIRELREALGLFAGAMPMSPKQAWDEAITNVRGRWPGGESTGLIERAADMLVGYAELVKMTGKYAEYHYSPSVEATAEGLRQLAMRNDRVEDAGGLEQAEQSFFQSTPLEERWWLIETVGTPRPMYFAGDTMECNPLDSQFVTDVNQAIRFPSKLSAEGFLTRQMGLLAHAKGPAEESLAVLRMRLSCYRVAEHTFDYTPGV